MKNKNFQVAVSSLLIGLIFSSYLSLSSFMISSENIRKNVLRLHIKANSDTDFDRQLKLKVRDEILKESSDIFSGASDLEDAVKNCENAKEKIQKTAEKTIAENGYNYPVKIEIGRSFFPVKTYENTTLPAGDYTALRITIGEGKGHNWWCVMFPPLCLPAAEGEKSLSDVLSEDEENLTKQNPKYEFRFKIAELIEKFCSKAK